VDPCIFSPNFPIGERAQRADLIDRLVSSSSNIHRILPVLARHDSAGGIKTAAGIAESSLSRNAMVQMVIKKYVTSKITGFSYHCRVLKLVKELPLEM